MPIAAPDDFKVDCESDYGSDFDIDEAVFDEIQALPTVDSEIPIVECATLDADQYLARRPPVLDLSQQATLSSQTAVRDEHRRIPASVELDRESVSFVQDESPGRISFEPYDATNDPQDTRSPLQRFRTAPKKPLSVTDLVSPAWCEQQYWYSLTKYGRVKRTPAMKQGSVVHKVLEEQVHQTVPVNVQTKEDHWGLRIWNVIQGLRTLRLTGLTREMEIWGTVDGQVINGIIDEISYNCPDETLESSTQPKLRAKDSVPSDQPTIAEFFKGRIANSKSLDLPRDPRKAYLTDVKTRGGRSLPSGVRLRGSRMQLMLYRQLLAELASNNVDAEIIFQRYALDSSKVFSDSFIQQLSSLEAGLQQNPLEDGNAPMDADVDTAVEILTHNNLLKLWMLMITEFQLTLPNGADSIGKVLRVEFRLAGTGNILGVKTFLHDEQEIQTYLDDEMRWWKGEREVKGVEIEEAFKCGICEFAENCTWRINKIEDAVQKSRRRTSASQKTPG